ncbi:PAS domain-containing sensor histidine kinase [Maridesulfovibrio bastinii]|uniref:PAS domain-containing sensor histidine kinase n=1 Tax=Maridesulfovibrio bastinii TaxID=47157 RepID=UPI0004070951|nr:PAS domain S-box protein [Maridesulfovibrio bastinii]
MKTVFRQNKMKLGIVAVVMLITFVFIIVWMNYSSQLELRRNALEKFQAETIMEADAFQHFFSKRKDDLKNLAARNIIRIYFDNKALGMTMQYGLGASLIEVSNQLNNFIENKSYNGKRIYEAIRFYDSDRNQLSGSNGPNKSNFNFNEFLLSEDDEYKITAKVEGSKIFIIAAYPFYYKKSFSGTLIALLNSEAILNTISYNHFIFDDSTKFFFNYQNYIYPLTNSKNKKIVKIDNLPATDTISNKKENFETGTGKILEIRTNIKNSPFYIYAKVQHTKLLGSISPWQMMSAITVLAILLLGITMVVLKMNTDNMLLQVHLVEKEKQEQLIKDKNKTLQEQIYAREVAESALQEINEKLENRVRERTTALEKQTLALKSEILERKEAESALRIFFNNTYDAIIIHDADGNLITTNERMLQMFEVDQDEVFSYSLLADYTVSETNRDEIRQIWQTVLEGRNISLEWHSRCPKTGRTFYTEIVLNRIELNKKPLILANVRDITERKKIQQQQNEHEKFLNTIFEEIGAAIFVFNTDNGEIVHTNSKSEELLGIPAEQIKENSCQTDYIFAAETKRQLLCPEWDGHEIYEEGVLYIPDSKPLPTSLHLFEVSIGGVKHIVEVVFDISERKNLERKLSVAQKLESIGLLASGIAHEINTPIQYIGDNIQFLQNAFEDMTELFQMYSEHLVSLSDPEKSKEYVKRIEEFSEDIDIDFLNEEIPNACKTAKEGVHRVAEIVLAMKNFSHPGEEEMKAIDINSALENTLTVAKNEWKYAADLEVQLDKEIPLVQGLPGGINQVFLNILVNAAHAISDDKTKEGKGLIKISTGIENNHVVIKISDSGCGISKENMEKVFDPFFTTKEVGKGTGQGLSIVHDIIVDKHGGSIDIESEPGVGTTFTVKLPATDQNGYI